MTNQDNNNVLNGVVVAMAHSFLQYVAEAWTWVQQDAANVEEQVRVLAARQRQDVGELAELLTEREYAIDFGTFPTQYTDLQFLSLEKLMHSLQKSHRAVVHSIAEALSVLQSTDDAEAIELLTAIQSHEQGIDSALQELGSQLQSAA